MIDTGSVPAALMPLSSASQKPPAGRRGTRTPRSGSGSGGAMPVLSLTPQQRSASVLSGGGVGGVEGRRSPPGSRTLRPASAPSKRPLPNEGGVGSEPITIQIPRPPEGPQSARGHATPRLRFTEAL